MSYLCVGKRGTKTIVGIEQTFGKANQLDAAIDRGVVLDEQVAKLELEPTLEDLFNEYFQGHIKKRKKSTFETSLLLVF